MMKKFYIFLLLIVAVSLRVNAQTMIEVKPLFEYPVAPEEIKELDEKCNYLVKNFWNDFDFKSKNPVDQYALNDAFHVYSSAFRFASIKDVDQSVNNLIKNISSNPLLMQQFTKAAEENLYGPRADFWLDEVYLKFLDAYIKNKKIDKNKKNRYIRQAETLRKSAIGETAPVFWFEDRERASKRYFPMSTPTIIIFGDPDNTDWRLSRLRMESNYKLSDALEKGKINILFIVTKEDENWKNIVNNYNPRWTTGYSEDAAKSYDIRNAMSIFLVGGDGKILKKNLPVEEIVNNALEIIN